MALRSPSAVPMGLRSKVLTRVSSTAGVMKAGRDGPRRMFLIPRCSSVSRIAHRLLLVPGDDQRQRQVVDRHVERVGQGQGDLDGRVGVVALAHVEQPGDAADRRRGPCRRSGTCRRRASAPCSPAGPSRRTRCSSSARVWRRRSRPRGRSAGWPWTSPPSMTFSAAPRTALRAKPTVTSLPGSSSAKPGMASARSITGAKSWSLMCGMPGQPTRPLVKRFCL